MERKWSGNGAQMEWKWSGSSPSTRKRRTTHARLARDHDAPSKISRAYCASGNKRVWLPAPREKSVYHQGRCNAAPQNKIRAYGAPPEKKSRPWQRGCRGDDGLSRNATPKNFRACGAPQKRKIGGPQVEKSAGAGGELFDTVNAPRKISRLRRAAIHNADSPIHHGNFVMPAGR